MPFCRECGKEVQEDWVTCPYCSHPIGPPSDKKIIQDSAVVGNVDQSTSLTNVEIDTVNIAPGLLANYNSNTLKNAISKYISRDVDVVESSDVSGLIDLMSEKLSTPLEIGEPVKICPDCDDEVLLATNECSYCGYGFLSENSREDEEAWERIKQEKIKRHNDSIEKIKTDLRFLSIGQKFTINVASDLSRGIGSKDVGFSKTYMTMQRASGSDYYSGGRYELLGFDTNSQVVFVGRTEFYYQEPEKKLKKNQMCALVSGNYLGVFGLTVREFIVLYKNDNTIQGSLGIKNWNKRLIIT